MHDCLRDNHFVLIQQNSEEEKKKHEKIIWDHSLSCQSYLFLKKYKSIYNKIRESVKAKLYGPNIDHQQLTISFQEETTT